MGKKVMGGLWYTKYKYWGNEGMDEIELHGFRAGMKKGVSNG